MMLPLGSAAVLELAGSKWLIAADRVEQLAAPEEVRGPRIHLTDFDGAMQGVERVAGSGRHAAALIEQGLRDRGDVEGSSKVVLAQSQSRGGATRALYCAVPMDRFNECLEQAGAHGDHSLLVPCVALLAERARRIPGKTAYLLFQHGLNIDLLVLVDQAPHALLRVSSAGPEDADWERALDALAAELALLQSRLEQARGSALWVDWDPRGLGAGEKLRGWLETHTTLRPEAEPPCTLQLDGRPFTTSLPALFPLWRSRMAVNPPPALALYWSERALPFALTALGGIALALCLVAWQWHQRSNDLALELAGMEDELSALDPGAGDHRPTAVR